MIKKHLFFLLMIVVAAAACNRSDDGLAQTSPTPVGPTPLVEAAIAFPGAEGYGKVATGGRGGRVIKVTTLADSGPGSLREAINASGPRYILFEVSGNIELQSKLVIKNGNLTIAGQSAPGDGICIQNYEVQVDADNVIIRFLRFRMGDKAHQQADALWGRYHQNIIIDHCSVSWSIDECASFYSNKSFTMQWCLIAESLNKSFHEKENHGYGGIWGGTGASFHHNLLAHHNSRNPRFNGGGRSGMQASPLGAEEVDFLNNVIYNWGSNSAYGGENGKYNLVANYYKWGPATESSKRRRIMEISMDAAPAHFPPGFGTFYIHGNVVEGNEAVTADNWNGGVDLRAGVVLSAAKKETPFPFETIAQHTAEKAFALVLNFAGACLSRDAVDARIVQEVRTGSATYSGSKTGRKGIIDSQDDVGGWPFLKTATAPKDSDGDGMPDEWERSKGLDPNKADVNGRTLSTAFDNIEVYLNSLVQHITQAQNE